MKTLVISDTHGLHLAWEELFPIPEDIDMIIHAGDLTNMGSISDFNLFSYWFKNLPIEHKIMIAGNHDFGLENHNKYLILESFRGSGVHYLEDSGVTIEGINFWGSPVTPPFYDWAFMREPEKIVKHWDVIPDDTDVLITHGPMYGVLDQTLFKGAGSVGCKDLVNAIERVKPKIHCSGHIHNMYGKEEKNGVTHYNASVLDDRYVPVRAGHIMDLYKSL